MKKRISIFAMLLFISAVVVAQPKPIIEISDIDIHEDNMMVNVSFALLVKKLNSNYKLTLIPTLSGGTHSQTLREITVKSRKRSTIDSRNGINDSQSIQGIEGKELKYHVSVPFEQWMNELSLSVANKIEGCCNEQSLPATMLVSNKQIRTEILPVFRTEKITPSLSALEIYDKEASFLYPATDFNKRYEIFEKQRDKGALITYFEQGKFRIDPSYRNNRATLNQVNKVLDLIDADPNASLKKIVIIGMTSPEGSLSSNEVLAKKRAESLKHFVGERVKYNPELFEIINGSEDWEGLRKLVEESRMPDRWKVMEIIDKYSINGGREKRLMDLNKGIPYRYMYANFFPQLRNAGYVQIYYDSTPDINVEIANKAIELVKQQKYNEALPLLLSITTDMGVENLIGVCYMMQQDYINAKIYFEKAIKFGDENAKINLNNILKHN